MCKVNRVSLFFVCVVTLIAVFGCGMMEAPKGKVFFSEPADSAVINGSVKVVMGVEGKKIKPAGEIVEGTDITIF